MDHLPQLGGYHEECSRIRKYDVQRNGEKSTQKEEVVRETLKMAATKNKTINCSPFLYGLCYGLKLQKDLCQAKEKA